MAEWSDWYTREDPTRWVLPRILRERAEAHPDRPYFRFGDGEWASYGEIDARADRVANALIARGLQKGECVSTLLPNCADHLPLWFGILRAGGVQSPINLAYKGDFLSWVINLPRSRYLVIADTHLDRLAQVAGDLPDLEHVIVWESGQREGPDPAVRWEPFAALLDAPAADPGVEVTWTDDARIMFTSGTTGRSKGVIKQHASDYFSGRTYNEVCGVGEDDVFFTCLPLFHSNAQVLCCYPALIAGARVQMVERYSSSRFWTQVAECGATILNTVSAMNYFIWNTPPSERDRGHTVSRIMAMPAPKDVFYDFQDRFGIRFVEGYGLTETGMVTYVPPGEQRPGSCGQASPGFEVSVVEPGTDRPLPPDAPGEIVVDMKLPNIVMRAYAGMPEKTAEDFRNLKLHTGDLGRMDRDGYLYFMDRVKDYIRRRGENVSSVEVERIVCQHPQVLEAAAIGVKAKEGASAEDEILICLVAREGGAPDPGDLVEFCAERMPYFAVPRYIRVMDHLPKTPTERVRKVELRDAGVTEDTYDREAGGPRVTA
ncbi:MAG: AMP-binding protein [Thermoleophilia bacterium]|nr:AMP-binding protein [Thermoleophilia bacterium]